MKHTQNTAEWKIITPADHQKVATLTDEKTVNAFAILVEEYELQATHRTSEKAYEKALTDLAYAVVNAVLKKLDFASGNLTIKKMRRDTVADRRNLADLAYCVNHSTEYKTNKNGDTVESITDRELYKRATDLLSVSLSDCADLVNTAVSVIMDETVKALTERELTAHFMTDSYTVRRMKKKVIIKDEDTVKGWETVEVSPITETFKAVRNEVEKNGSVQVSSFKYAYFEDLCKDTESETETVIYRRLPLYSDLIGQVCDFNGKETVLVADKVDTETVAELIEMLNLSDRQAVVLSLRLKGYGQKAIATYLGVSQRAIQKTQRLIQCKAYDIGLCPIEMQERPTPIK